jgi:MYXO-CTERM domain-containing protein
MSPLDAAVDKPVGQGDGATIDVAFDADGSRSDGGHLNLVGSDDSGCGCRTSGSGMNGSWGALGLAWLILARAMGRRKEMSET